MNRHWLILSLLWGICIGTWSCETAQEALEVPQTRPITIDGNLNDWTTNLQKVPNQEALFYSTATDAHNFYLALRLSNRGLQRQVMNLGMTIHLDTMAKRREKIGLGYPLALSEEQLESVAFAATKDGRLDEKALLEAYAATSQDFELVGFVEEEPKERIRVSNLSSKGIKTAIGQDQLGALLIEYRIPFRQLYDRAPTGPLMWNVGIQINNPEASADDDPGLFDDPSSNPITGSGQTNNPLMQGNNLMAQRQATPTRRTNGNILKVWTLLQLTPKGE